MDRDITRQVRRFTSIRSVTRGHLKPGCYTTEKRYSDCWVFVLNGGGIYNFGDRDVEVTAGGILYLANNSRYTIQVTHPEYTFIFVDFYFENPEAKLLRNAFFGHPSLQAEAQRFRELLRLWPAATPAEQVWCLGLMHQIYARIIAAQTASYLPTARRDQMEAAAAILRSRYADPELSIEAVAEELGLSPVHFRRLFRQVYGTGPARFLGEIRISHARGLLAQFQLPIQDIAGQCGFSSAYYFSRAFKKLTGLSPTEFRRG